MILPQFSAHSLALQPCPTSVSLFALRENIGSTECSRFSDACNLLLTPQQVLNFCESVRRLLGTTPQIITPLPPSKSVDYLPHINHSATTKILKLQQMRTCSTKVWTCTSLSTQCSFFPQKPWTSHLSTSAGHELTFPPLCKDILDLQQVSNMCLEPSVRPTCVLDKCLHKCQTEEFGICES